MYVAPYDDVNELESIEDILSVSFEDACVKRKKLKKEILEAIDYQSRFGVQSPIINCEQAELKYEKLISYIRQYLIVHQKLVTEFSGFEDNFSHRSAEFQEIIPKLKHWQQNSNEDLLLKQCELDKEFSSLVLQFKNPQLSVDSCNYIVQKLKEKKEEFENFLLGDEDFPQIIRLLNNHNKILDDIANKFNNIFAFIRMVKEGKKVFAPFHLQVFSALALPKYRVSSLQQEILYNKIIRCNLFHFDNVVRRRAQLQSNSSRFAFILCVSNAFCLLLQNASWRNYISVLITMFRVGFDVCNLFRQTKALKLEHDDFNRCSINYIFKILQESDNEQDTAIAIQRFVDDIVDAKNQKLKDLWLVSKKRLQLQVVNALLSTGQIFIKFLLLSEERRSLTMLLTGFISLWMDDVKKICGFISGFLAKSWTSWSFFAESGSTNFRCTATFAANQKILSRL